MIISIFHCCKTLCRKTSLLSWLQHSVDLFSTGYSAQK